jgi:urease accessory protein
MPLADTGLLRLLTWLSPSFPVGGFSYSHGLELAVEAGLVRDRRHLADWLGTVLSHGAGRVDATLLASAWRATCADDGVALAAATEWAAAMRGTAETALESAAQGRAFLDTVRQVWPDPWLEKRAEMLALGGYAVAVGVAAARAGVPLEPTLVGYLHAFAANLVSAAVRLVPLGQTDGQRALAALEPVILAAAAAAIERPLAEIGSATPMVEWASMRHETQYTRLFRS